MLKTSNKISSLKRLIGEIEIEMDYIDDLTYRKEKEQELNHYRKELKDLFSKKKK